MIQLANSELFYHSSLRTNDFLRQVQDNPGELAQASNERASIFIHPEIRFQTILGFGGAFTEAAASVFWKLKPEARERLLTAYFNADDGHGYTFCRTHINSCDFSRGSYSYNDEPGDFALKNFSINCDREQLIPFIIEASKRVSGDFKLLASPWSPPAWMKTNQSMLNGGKLRSDCRQVWADYYCRYIEAYKEHKLEMFAITVQNEPEAKQRWESCLYTAEEERDFVRDYLGPTLCRNGHGDVKIIGWDHNRDHLVDRASILFGDSDAAKYFWGIGFHWYANNCFEQVRQVREAYPDKQLIFTEGCQENGPHLGSWDVGERYGRSLINDLNNGATAWVDWNLLLDDRGGPNHVGNYCSAPILATQMGDLHFNPSYYFLGHFSRFIRPHAQRIVCAVSDDAILTTAFLNTDGTIAMPIMNPTEVSYELSLKLDGNITTFQLPPKSIQTRIFRY